MKKKKDKNSDNKDKEIFLNKSMQNILINKINKIFI